MPKCTCVSGLAPWLVHLINIRKWENGRPSDNEIKLLQSSYIAEYPQYPLRGCICNYPVWFRLVNIWNEYGATVQYITKGAQAGTYLLFLRTKKKNQSYPHIHVFPNVYIAEYKRSKDGPWFSKVIVNRIGGANGAGSATIAYLEGQASITHLEPGMFSDQFRKESQEFLRKTGQRGRVAHYPAGRSGINLKTELEKYDGVIDELQYNLWAKMFNLAGEMQAKDRQWTCGSEKPLVPQVKKNDYGGRCKRRCAHVTCSIAHARRRAPSSAPIA